MVELAGVRFATIWATPSSLHLSGPTCECNQSGFGDLQNNLSQKKSFEIRIWLSASQNLEMHWDVSVCYYHCYPVHRARSGWQSCHCKVANIGPLEVQDCVPCILLAGQLSAVSCQLSADNWETEEEMSALSPLWSCSFWSSFPWLDEKFATCARTVCMLVNS